MRKRNECGILTKWLVYSLVVSLVSLTMPTWAFAPAYAATDTKSVYLFGFSAKEAEGTPVELVSKVESYYKETLKAEEGVSYLSPSKAKQALEGKDAEAFKDLKGKVREQQFDKSFFAGLKTVGKGLKADYLVIGVFKGASDESTFYTLVYNVKGEKLYQAAEVVFKNDMKGVNKRTKGSYDDTLAVLQSGKSDKALSAGFVLAAPGAAPVAEEPKAPEPAPAPAPKPVAKVEEPKAGPVNLDVDNSILLSSDDANKAREDSTSETSIDPVKKTPVYKQWWLWTVVGAVVVGGAIATGVILKPDNKAKKNRVALPGVQF